MGDIITLRGVVFSRYKTIEDFAKAIGWKRNKASRIINGIQHPNIDDIIELTKVLEITDRDAFVALFFKPLSSLLTKTEMSEASENR